MDKLRKEFLNPSREYTPIPFWFWNDRLDEKEIIRQINDFNDKGVNGFVIHPRIGLPKDIGYMSEVFLGYVKCAVSEAARLGMRVMLYDEGMYPSGSAHGMVVEDNPQYASRGLEMREYKSSDLRGGLPKLKPWEKLVSLQEVRKKNGKYDKKTCRTIEPDGHIFENINEDDWYVDAFIETNTEGTIRGIHFGEDDGQEGAPPSSDLLNIKATEKFISLTHEKYYDALKDYFGNTIIAMFTDEPMIMGRQHKEGLVAWTKGFLKDFVNGGNRETDLIQLFDDINEETRLVRRRYDEAVNKRLEQTYYRPLCSWCESHNILLTGHPEKSMDIGLLKNFGIPGQDVVWRYIGPEDGKGLLGPDSTMAKCSSDAARHHGKRRNMNECFGCCGHDGNHWAFSADDMKWYLDWLFVRGVNMIIPHAFFYSVQGEGRYNERPPDVGPNNIWWSNYKEISDYIKRMSWLMTESANQTAIAVLCSGDFLPWEIVKPLYESQTEFNYLESELLASPKCEIKSGKIAVQKQKYGVLLIEDETMLTPELQIKLNIFVEQGGRVIALGNNNNSFDNGYEYIKDFSHILNKVGEKDKCIKICPANKSLRATHVKKGGKNFYLFANEGEEEVAGRITINKYGNAEKWDAWRGKTEEIAVNATDGKRTEFDIVLKRRESIIYAIDGN